MKALTLVTMRAIPCLEKLAHLHSTRSKRVRPGRRSPRQIRVEPLVGRLLLGTLGSGMLVRRRIRLTFPIDRFDASFRAPAPRPYNGVFDPVSFGAGFLPLLEPALVFGLALGLAAGAGAAGCLADAAFVFCSTRRFSALLCVS